VGEGDIAVDDQARWPDHDGEQVRDSDHPRLFGDDLGHFAEHGGRNATPGKKIPVRSEQEHRGEQEQQADERTRHRVRRRVSCHLTQDEPGRGRDAADHGAASGDHDRGRCGIGASAQVVPQRGTAAGRLLANGSQPDLQSERIQHDRRDQHQVGDRVGVNG
jgi:hypothetical protein